MDKIGPTPTVNPRMAKLAELLRRAKEGMNSWSQQTQMPGFPIEEGNALGDAMLGEAPDEVKNWGQGDYPIRINPDAGRTASYMPEITPGRQKGVADALMAVPFSGGGAVEKSMLVAGGNPRLILARGTDEHALMSAMKKSKQTVGNMYTTGQGMYNPSIAISKDKLPDEFGDVFVLPHPRAVDPKTNPRNVLYNVDAFTGGAERHTNDTRLMYENPPDSDEYALRIAASPKFNSFAHYETSPYGAASLGELDPVTGMVNGPTNQASFDKVIKQLDRSRPNWRDEIADPFSDPESFDPFLLDKIRRRAPKTFEKLAPEISKIRKASGVGQAHSELKLPGFLPMSPDNIQHVLYPSHEYVSMGGGSRVMDMQQMINGLRSRGIEVSSYGSSEEAVDMAREIQKSAKFASKLREKK